MVLVAYLTGKESCVRHFNDEETSYMNGLSRALSCAYLPGKLIVEYSQLLKKLDINSGRLVVHC